MRVPAGILVLVATFWISTASQSIDSRLMEADLAWDRGDYPTALSGYLALLETPDADRFLDPIALQTGELFHTRELTRDGSAPRYSPTGEHFTYEIGRGVTRTTRLASAAAPEVVLAELPGYGAVFSPDGSRLAYLALSATSEMRDLERSADLRTGTERTKQLAALARLTETAARITVRQLSSGQEREIEVAARKSGLLLLPNDGVLFTGRDNEDKADQLFLAGEDGRPRKLTEGERGQVLLALNTSGTAALFNERPASGGSRSKEPVRFGLVSLPEGGVTFVIGSAPAFSADGGSVAYISRAEALHQLAVRSVTDSSDVTVIRSGPERLDAPAWAPDGGRLAFQMMQMHDWELHVIARDGTGEMRITREIQHDIGARFLSNDRLLGLMGEVRHRRSYLYDLPANRRIRLFHNNTVRTISPEYAWAPAPDGTKLLIVAERDGDTVSPERGVYLMDLTRRATIDELRARVTTSLRLEQALRTTGRKLFAPIADAVRAVVEQVSTARIFGYEKALFDFDSKHVTKPGNKLAAEYLFNTYRSFGYEPEYQHFSVKGALDGRTANVLATLKGTVNPELVYVVSSHFDSVAEGPGADDNTSGTAALLETARILATRPQPATIVFASFSAEESGLLGSREYVRRAKDANVRIAGALNNDMLGWTNDHRLDNTIRYSSPGIRDIQHAAAMQFSRLITYDALYYKNTDAHAYYEVYGDLVGGLGGYPILGNPHYHQPHDALETVNHQLVAEVAKTTTATVMLLASSPSRVKDLQIDSAPNGTVAVSWAPSPEKSVVEYRVVWGPADRPESQQIRVNRAATTIKAARGAVVAVKAVNDKRLEGWDWARATIP